MAWILKRDGASNYYDQTNKGLGYVTPPARSELDTDESLSSHSSNLSDWESDVSVGLVFKNLFANMASISQVEQDEGIESFDADSWAQQLDLQWKKHFEQHKSLTEDKVVQVDVGDQGNPKLISISESLSPDLRQNFFSLIQEYLDVFAWSYEDMPGLDPQVTKHHLNIKSDTKPVK